MNEVQGHRKLSDDDLKDPGDFYFAPLADLPGEFILYFKCPCGNDEVAGIHVGDKRKPRSHRPSWEWNGDFDKPTCKPSILRRGGCKWHGYLTDGVFKSV